MSSSLSITSLIEVERKFLPTARLKAHLGLRDSITSNNTGTGAIDDALAEVGGVRPDLSLFRLPDKQIQDTYYDINDELVNKDTWVRRRTSRAVASSDFALVQEGQPTTKWEAKVRLGGDYVDSQFLEVKGEAEVTAIAVKHLSNQAIEDLRVTTDLETHRKTWVVHDPVGWAQREGHIEERVDEIRILLDCFTAPAVNADTN